MTINWISGLFTILISYTFQIILTENNIKTYGPYEASWDKYEICKGPKRWSCGDVNINNLHNMSNIIFNLNISKDCALSQAKVAIGTIKQSDNATKKLWNYKLNNPCQHFVLGPILARAFNLTSKCIVIKGHYEVAINMHEISTNFLGVSFFYDTYFFKVMAYNDRNNFICVDTVVKLSPKL